MNTEIKKWYMENYPNDELGEEINSGITFNDLFFALDTCRDAYRVLGVGDSIIRERVFSKLANLLNVDYDYVYEKWLKC